jgi:hypothetical protein
MWWSQRGHKWLHNMAHTSCMLDKQGCIHARASTRPPTRAHAQTRAHTHTHTQICSVCRFSTAKMIRERGSMLRYMCISFLLTLALDKIEWTASLPYVFDIGQYNPCSNLTLSWVLSKFTLEVMTEKIIPATTGKTTRICGVTNDRSACCCDILIRQYKVQNFVGVYMYVMNATK